MKLLFTTQGENWASPMDPRFGRTQMALVYDETTNQLKVLSNSGKDDAQGAGLKMAANVLKANIDVIITGNGAGEKAIKVLENSSVKLFVGAGEMCVQEAYEAYKKGALAQQL
ncbi:NifB/NifX family molybdenum-iron cluster-binding protein [Sulfurospirillum sp. T05]|uniref:NifB/NifX family molybdenum-iron cluster-binding protein n=1 Tax=Sulfurospirillum tamanense TaxID=2813362 RepID=A0ABS2WUA5_9BACT|nr:NifB/NifX family molybdenum-iron cluster-binding protein [Sulfurospirillum tamanensis]MBN2965227.1 NifB/NifX family molybdenum-iron cluster-binding protein [Sulfurospirillum tamanensis]